MVAYGLGGVSFQDPRYRAQQVQEDPWPSALPAPSFGGGFGPQSVLSNALMMRRPTYQPLSAAPGMTGAGDLMQLPPVS